ncbi:MAG: hypothetical protein V7K71_01395 [Nostoc sp.]
MRLRQLHQVASRDSSVDWLLQGLGILPNHIISIILLAGKAAGGC